MASFIIHTISGETFLRTLKEKYNINISKEKEYNFLLGNLVADTLSVDKTIPSNLSEKELITYKMEIKNNIRKEKLKTHFRDISKEGECIKSPDPNLFINKYQDLLKDNFSVLGYLFHLYTDKIFFTELFTRTFENVDKYGNKVKYDKDLKFIKINKTNKLIDSKEFWSGTSEDNIYNDYTIMNKILLEKFGISFNIDELYEYSKNSFKNPGIEEVSYKNVSNIIIETKKYITESYNLNGEELSIFNREDIIEFVPYVVNKFLKEYKFIIDFYN